MYICTPKFSEKSSFFKSKKKKKIVYFLFVSFKISFIFAAAKGFSNTITGILVKVLVIKIN
jgi:hypothetical protein